MKKEPERQFLKQTIKLFHCANLPHLIDFHGSLQQFTADFTEFPVREHVLRKSEISDMNKEYSFWNGQNSSKMDNFSLECAEFFRNEADSSEILYFPGEAAISLKNIIAKFNIPAAGKELCCSYKLLQSEYVTLRMNKPRRRKKQRATDLKYFIKPLIQLKLANFFLNGNHIGFI